MMIRDRAMRILFVEDLPTDVELAERELLKQGLSFVTERADDLAGLLASMEAFRPDVVVSDYSMPSFDGMAALLAVRERDGSMPFIVLTGSMNEDTAVACMKAGASDYVIKEHISRLPFAVAEAIEHRELKALAEAQEDALRRSEERYRSIFSDTDAVMLIIDPESSVIVDANKAAADFYGWTRAELIGKPMSDIITLSPERLRVLMRMAVGEKKNHFEFKHRRADGTVTDVESHSGPVMIGDKKFLFSIIHDISDRRTAERERDQASQKLAHYIDMSPTIIYSLRLADGEARMEWVSENLESILGFSSAEAEEPDWWFRNLYAADREEASKGIKTLVERKSISHDYRFVRKDKRTVWLRDDMRIVPGADNGMEIIGTLTDVTVQKLAEEELRLKGTALEALDEAVIITDREGEIRWANPGFEKLTGYAIAEALGKNPRDLLKSGMQEPAAYAELWDTILSGRTWRGQLVNKKKSGELYNEEMSITPVTGPARRVEHFIAIKYDVTERTESRQRLEASLREKVVLLREIHHRVKNNMQVVSSLINLSSDEVTDPALSGVLGELHRRIETMAIVHEQFYASGDASRIDFSLYLRQLTNNLIEDMRLKQGAVRVEFKTEPLFLDLESAIPAGLILSELVSNALEAMTGRPDPGGRLELSVLRDAAGLARIRVSDTGPGLVAGFDPRAAKSLGMRLIGILSDQLHGGTSFSAGAGAVAELSFPLRADS